MDNNNLEKQEITNTENSEEIVVYPNIPFENEDYTFIKGFFTSVGQIFFSPNKFFRTMHLNKGYYKPLLFALICILIGTTTNFFYMENDYIDTPKEQIQKMLTTFENATDERIIEVRNVMIELSSKMTEFHFTFGTLAQQIFTILGNILLISLVWHLCITIFRLPNNGLQATIRVFCYLSATNLLNLIPLNIQFSSSLTLIVGVIILFSGLKEAHELTLTQTIGAIFLPPLFLSLLIGIMM